MRGYLFRWVFVMGVLLMCGRAGGAEADSAHLVDERWRGVVEAFAEALAVGNDDQVNSLLADRLMIRELDRRDPATVGRLMSRVEGGEVVGVLSYGGRPARLAEAIAGVLADSPMVPQHVRDWMSPGSELGMSRANATAARWVVESLGATDEDPVGVILMWCPVRTWPPTYDEQSRDYQLVFVLVKGNASGLAERISGVAFGNPYPASNRRQDGPSAEAQRWR